MGCLGISGSFHDALKGHRLIEQYYGALSEDGGVYEMAPERPQDYAVLISRLRRVPRIGSVFDQSEAVDPELESYQSPLPHQECRVYIKPIDSI